MIVTAVWSFSSSPCALHARLRAVQGAVGVVGHLRYETAEIRRKSKKSRLSGAKCHYVAQRIGRLSGGDIAQRVGVYDGACAAQQTCQHTDLQNVVVILLRIKGVNRMTNHFTAQFTCH